MMTQNEPQHSRARRIRGLKAKPAIRSRKQHFETRPFLKIRRGYLVAAGRRKNIIHGLIEIDVTELRRLLADPVLLWRAVMSNPIWFKRFGGTVGISSIGMFGPGGGWRIPIAPPTLMITVGGIGTKPRYVDGSLQREMLDLTVSVDHDLIDGGYCGQIRSAAG
jgi:hypothetical protein